MGYDNLSVSIYARFGFRKVFFDADFRDYFENTFKSIVKKKVRLSDLSSLYKKEYDIIINQWNANERSYPKDQTLVDLFESHGFKSPESTRLVYEGTSLSYQELNERSINLKYNR